MNNEQTIGSTIKDILSVTTKEEAAKMLKSGKIASVSRFPELNDLSGDELIEFNKFAVQTIVETFVSDKQEVNRVYYLFELDPEMRKHADKAGMQFSLRRKLNKPEDAELDEKDAQNTFIRVMSNKFAPLVAIKTQEDADNYIKENFKSGMGFQDKIRLQGATEVFIKDAAQKELLYKLFKFDPALKELVIKAATSATATTIDKIKEIMDIKK